MNDELDFDWSWLGPFLWGCAVALVIWVVLGPGIGTVLGWLFPPDTKFFWYLSRAAGVTAYLLLSVSMLLGLGVFTRLLDAITPRANSFTLHEHTSWLALGFLGLHTGALLFDRAQPFSLPELLVPLASAYRPVPVALGIMALYAAALLVASFYLKPRLSQHAWRTLHYASFAAYVLATAHGIFAGSDSGQAWMQWIYLGSGATVLFCTLFRILKAPRGGRADTAAERRPRPAARPAPRDPAQVA